MSINSAYTKQKPVSDNGKNQKEKLGDTVTWIEKVVCLPYRKYEQNAQHA